MDVVGEAGGVWGVHCQPAEFPSFWKVFRGWDVILGVIVVIRIIPQ